uniref:Lysine exporter protein (LYSE/YGGA) n=1 Tax=Caulobacter sp. (strain K31) TaxID=366602 RepID=B0T1R8_CAUSK
MSLSAWPVDPGLIVPFLAAILLIELTPGPNMGYLAALSVVHGRRAGFYAVAGVTCGLAVYMFAAVFGLTEAFRLYRPLYELLRWAGVAYLIWLAWDAWRAADGHDPGADLLSRPWALFQRGFLANILNPKAALFYVTLLPGFIAVDHGPPARQALILGGLHVLVSIMIHGSIVLSADKAGRLLARVASSAWVSRGLAISILVVAIWLAWETRGRG